MQYVCNHMEHLENPKQVQKIPPPNPPKLKKHTIGPSLCTRCLTSLGACTKELYSHQFWSPFLAQAKGQGMNCGKLHTMKRTLRTKNNNFPSTTSSQLLMFEFGKFYIPNFSSKVFKICSQYSLHAKQWVGLKIPGSQLASLKLGNRYSPFILDIKQ